jgi:uncharacterized membrane protein YkvA (DUF1232 family)
MILLNDKIESEVIRTLERLKSAARRLKSDIRALYLAYRDPRVSWQAKVVIAAVVAYALSPVDLIPDFIPVLGYLDDLLLLPLGIWLALRMIPAEVMSECRARAAGMERLPSSRTALAVIIILWILVIAALLRRVLT